MNAVITDKEIINYYDECKVDYEIVWHLKSQMCMHYGYWDDTTKTLRSALRNMNEKFASFANIKHSEYVLDAGCGVGGSSLFLGKAFHCKTEGISLSEKQVVFANEKVKEAGLDKTVSFSVQNYTQTNFPDNYFDVVWAMESVCHAAEKQLFLKEAFRILKKGGRLVVADFFSNSLLYSNDHGSWLQKWARSWAIPSFECLDNFKSKAGKTGFTNIESVDVTEQITPTANRLYFCFVPGIICDNFLRVFGNRTAANKANVWSTLYQYKSLKAGMWSYHFVKAVK